LPSRDFNGGAFAKRRSNHLRLETCNSATEVADELYTAEWGKA
jgi:hypothetical protein